MPSGWRFWRAFAGGALKGLTYTLPVFIEGSCGIGRGSWSITSGSWWSVIGVVVMGLLWLFTHYNRIGLALRGMAQDERAAMMLGIDSDRMAVAGHVLGFHAGRSGGQWPCCPLGNIVVEAGYNVLIMAIAVCIVGGLGSWVGAVLAAFVIGFAQILTVVYVESHFQIVVALLAIIVTLILKAFRIFSAAKKNLEERV